MKRRVLGRFIVVLFLFVALGLQAAFADEYARIDGEGLQKMMASGQKLVIVDLREPELYKKGHVPGSINIPYEGAKQRLLKELSKDDIIVFMCHGGPMGDELGLMLSENGYKKVYNVKGGMRKWKGPLTSK